MENFTLTREGHLVYFQEHITIFVGNTRLWDTWLHLQREFWSRFTNEHSNNNRDSVIVFSVKLNIWAVLFFSLFSDITCRWRVETSQLSLNLISVRFCFNWLLTSGVSLDELKVSVRRYLMLRLLTPSTEYVCKRTSFPIIIIYVCIEGGIII